MKKLSLLFISMVFIMTSCATGGTVKMVVASEKANCIGVAPQECLQVKIGDDTNWSFFYGNIEGFTHETGYEYVLDIKEEKLENVPADASSIKYTLVKVISKTKKESDNLLGGVPAPTKFSWTAKVVAIDDADVGVGAAKGKYPVKVVTLEVTSLGQAGMPFAEGATIHSELIAEPAVTPEVGKEYVFKAKESHPAHALGVYMLDTDVQDLVN